MELNISMLRKLLLMLVTVFSFTVLQAQEKAVSGTVTDANDGMGIPGVSVVVKGTTVGTTTDIDGNYMLNVDANSTLVYSFVGYKTQEILVGEQTQINVVLSVETENLSEVVVIGYGQVKKDDATGSVTAISSDDFNKGAITSPQELLSGKTAGVQITSGGGAPGAGSTIRIRGGSSLSASNDPLFVIDGVPVDTEGINGMRNPLNTIHPSDIETFTVLKDASATAIYGSRASNGVIIITTKKGKKGGDLKVGYNGYFSVSTRSDEIDVLDATAYRELFNQQFGSNPNATALLGNADTDWQDEIFQTAISHDHNVSLTGGIKGVPFRASIGYTDQEGILKTSELQRNTASVGFSPSLFDDHLKINVNLKGMYIDNRFADTGAIGSAIAYDPTQPVFDETSPYGGYHTWTVGSTGDPVDIATTNPLALLQMRKDESTVKRSIGNAQFDYKMHFLPELKANLNVGYDYSKSDGTIFVPENASWEYDAQNGGGVDREYSQSKRNKLLDFYFNYVKDLDQIDSRVDAMVGYSWQHFWRSEQTYQTNVAGTIVDNDTDNRTENYLVSFFGRLNYSFKDRYLLTLTVRRDGSSRFADGNKWGTFPSAAFAWKVNEEAFLKNVDVVSDLKLRLGYGVTGQQNITSNDYPYLNSYTFSEANAQYQFGDKFVTTLRPSGYDVNIKWEETTTYNAGLDFGFFNNRITGAVDVYYRKTEDLLNTIPVAAGTNLTNQILTNVGDLENKGIEFEINTRPISTPDLFWEVGFNVTYNKNEITKLTAVDDPNYLGVATGGIAGGVGNNAQIHSVGHASNSFFVWEQVYDANGKPIEGLYVDRNGDGEITEDDKYHYKKAAPSVYLGFSSKLSYKNWDFSFAGRANFNNYVYNNVDSNAGVPGQMYYSAGYLTNVTEDALNTGFNRAQYLSDYYVQDGSFLKLDNITLGYSFNEVFNGKGNIRLYTTVQNVFTITDYEGLDPEVSSGIDNNIYPRPRTFLLGVNIDF
jgi:Outer membrane receptor proteins, mostly Fe transport